MSYKRDQRRKKLKRANQQDTKKWVAKRQPLSTTDLLGIWSHKK